MGVDQPGLLCPCATVVVRTDQHQLAVRVGVRALSEGLSAQQSEDEFDATLDASIASIAAASAT